MKILLVTLLHPLPTNAARGTFIADHAQLLRDMGHDVRIVNPLPRLLKYMEQSRSTLTGVAKAPKTFEHNEFEIYAPRYLAYTDHPYPWLTSRSIRNRQRSIEKWLGRWRPDHIIAHTLWPVGELARSLSKRWDVPWTGVVHGHDVDVGLTHSTTGKRIKSLMESADSMVFVSDRLRTTTRELGVQVKKAYTIACHSEMDDEWARPMKKWKGRWRRESIDILFPADPRRPEKNHYLALQTGEILEQRGWIVGMTTLKQQPRSIVWDRMIVADVTLITSHRESGPLVARESILCGTPVVSTNVGDVATYLPNEFVLDDPTPEALADACEAALETDWSSSPIILPHRVSAEKVSQQWSSLLQGLEEEE